MKKYNNPYVGLAVTWSMAFFLNWVNMASGQSANWFLVLVPTGALAFNYWFEVFNND